MLVRLANSHRHVLENKRTDQVTSNAKNQVWLTIEEAFNALGLGPPRDAKSLRFKYEAIKRELRKTNDGEWRTTGGGPSTSKQISLTEEEVILRESIIISVNGMEPITGDSDTGYSTGINAGVVEEEEMVEAASTEEVAQQVILDGEVVGLDWANVHPPMLRTPTTPALSNLCKTEVQNLCGTQVCFNYSLNNEVQQNIPRKLQQKHPQHLPQNQQAAPQVAATPISFREGGQILKKSLAHQRQMTPSPNSLPEVPASIPDMTNKRDGPTDSRVNPNPVQLPGSSLQNYIGNRRFFRESERLKTFERWPVSFLPPRTMTEAGFYYLNRDDIVRCAFCNIEVGRWVEGDDPMADHERWAPACRFVRHQDVNNVPLGEEGSTSGDSGSESLEGYDVCGHGMEFQTESQKPTSVVEKHEGYIKSRAPCFANYATLDARLRSYDTWPISLKLKPDVLSDAGFFYTGKGDQTICYHCGGGLKDWEETDEPWVEHARWFSKCPYVLAVRGKSFIEEVNGARAVQDVTQNGNIGLSSSTGDLDRVPSAPVEEKVKKTTSEPVKTVGDQGSRSKEQNQTQAPALDGRLCKICFSEEMGAVFLPCGHIVACVKCAVSLTTCAICRQPVTGTFRAFLS